MFPMVALSKAAVTNFMFIDDLPLVLSVGILQHGTIRGRMVMGAAILGAPCTPRLTGFE